MVTDEEIPAIEDKRIADILKLKSKDGTRLFYVPIQLADIDLGWMVLKTDGFTMGLFSELISDFENMYLDDQLLHVLSQHGFEL